MAYRVYASAPGEPYELVHNSGHDSEWDRTVTVAPGDSVMFNVPIFGLRPADYYHYFPHRIPRREEQVVLDPGVRPVRGHHQLRLCRARCDGRAGCVARLRFGAAGQYRPGRKSAPDQPGLSVISTLSVQSPGLA
jgi:hypothetical protein